MKVITKDDLASLIDVDRLKDMVSGAAGKVSSKVKTLRVTDKEDNNDMKKFLKNLMIFIGVVAVICGVVYALYRYFTPNYDDEFDDDFDDAFDDDEDDEELFTDK